MQIMLQHRLTAITLGNRDEEVRSVKYAQFLNIFIICNFLWCLF
jgi:hypothetical protein